MPVTRPFCRSRKVPAPAWAYDPASERDACGGAIAAPLRGTSRHDILGGADSGSDCIGTAYRQHALALGFKGTDSTDIEDNTDIEDLLQVPLIAGTVEWAADYQTNEAGVFVAGEAVRGQSLIILAIAEGRAVASMVDRYPKGETLLPFAI